MIHRAMMRRIGLLIALGPLCVPGTALAEGMPQLDFKNPLTVDQVWWGAVIFVVFLLLCWLWGLPQVAGVLERRAAAIAADLETARIEKTAADHAATETTEAIAKARAEAQASINAALDAAKQETAAQTAELNARLETQLREAEQRIGAAREGAMRALRQVATETAGAVIVRLTGAAAEPERLQRAIGAAMTARGEG
ncbi:MAG TPA: F0F1 ATP synthase subunit B [Acetobacteraceae bacterium]|nr:F0F1 ATP synthase subunit B [Acetobacteraceae bacterium]